MTSDTPAGSPPPPYATCEPAYPTTHPVKPEARPGTHRRVVPLRRRENSA